MFFNSFYSTKDNKQITYTLKYLTSDFIFISLNDNYRSCIVFNNVTKPVDMD